MRLAILHSSSQLATNPIDAYLVHQAQCLTQAGHQVRVLTGPGISWPKYVEVIPLPLAAASDPDVQRVKAKLDHGRVPRLFHGLRETLSAQLHTALLGIEALFAHDVCSLNKNLALTAALSELNGTPGFPRLFCWHHDHAWLNPLYALEMHPHYPWNLLRMAWPEVTHVVPNQHWRENLAKLLKIEPSEIFVFPNETELAEQQQFTVQTIHILAQLHLTQAAPLVVLPTHPLAYKSLKLALSLWSAITARWPSAQLLIFALPTQKLEWQGQLEDFQASLNLNHNVHFLNETQLHPLPKVVFADFLRLADAMLLTELHPATELPNPVARAQPLPVFCSDNTPLPAWASRSATYFDPHTDPAHIATLVQKQLTGQAAYPLSQQARRALTWESLHRNYYTALLATPKV